MSRLQLNSRQRQRLRSQLQQTPDVRLFRRTLAVLEFDHGRPAADIARMLGVTRQTVHNWLTVFAADSRPDSLAEAERRGRPRLLDEDDLELLESLLVCSPQEVGFPHVSWTVPLLREALTIATGREASCDTIRRQLQEWEFVWKRPRYVLAPDPLREKKRRIKQQILALPSRSVVLAQDETDLLLFPPLRAGWALRGQPVEVVLSGWNARRVIFGAMNLRTGTRLFLPRPKGQSVDFQAFLEEVRGRYRGWHVAMLMDENRSHTAKASLKKAEGMTLLWLPKRSPELNPMDTLWGQGKDVISANKQYEPIEGQVNCFLDYLRGLSNHEALHTAGVHSDNFWLKPTLSKHFCVPA